jgi:hypothetical protein
MSKPSPAMLVALAALFVALGGVGVAATNGNFILGQTNTADRTTELSVSTVPSTCPAPCNALKVSDTSTASNAGGFGVLGKSASTPAATIKNLGGATALSLFVNTGKPPLAVNSATKVPNLNADRLDDLDSTSFLLTTGKAADADKLDGIDSTGFLSATGKATDADKLDGQDSTDFARTGLTWTAAPLTDYGDVWWGNWNAGWSQAAYARDPFGIVHLKGLVTCHGGLQCVVPPAIFVLPQGYRPALWSVFATLSDDQSARITIDPSGNVLPSIWHGNWISLDGITFPAA